MDALNQETAVTAFVDTTILGRGALSDVALAVHAHGQASGTVLVFDDRTGRVVDLDLRGTAAEVAARYSVAVPRYDDAAPRGRGRPKLGVVAREITLLPRHWEWLQAQSGGASAVIRRLIDEARKNDPAKESRKIAQERTYRFLTGLGGNLPHYEETVRALYADDRDRMHQHMLEWPRDISQYAMTLLSA